VKSAQAWTDVPDSVPEFISQRRRWLNGSFFAAFYAIFHFGQIFRTRHSIFRILLLLIEFVYNTIQMTFSWFQLGTFYLTFYMLLSAFSSSANPNYDPTRDPFFGYGDYVFQISRQIYLLVIVTIFVLSLGNRPQGSKWTYVFAMCLFSLIMCVMLYTAGFTVYLSMPTTPQQWQQIGNRIIYVPTFRNIVISLASTYGMYLISSILHMDPWHMITCFAQYMLLLPAFVNILMVYAFCNTHDVSWGTKGDSKPENDLGHVKLSEDKSGKQVVEFHMMTERVDLNANYDRLLQELSVRPKEEKKRRDAATKREDYYRGFRTRLVLAWMFSNAALVITFTSDFTKQIWISRMTPGDDFNPFLTGVFWAVAGLSAIRFTGSFSYLLLRLIFG